MARIIFFILLLANLAMFAWSAGYLGVSEEGREPERLQAQLQPERLNVSQDRKQETAPLVCRRTGPLEAGVADTLEKSLTAAGVEATRVSLDEPASYWVYVAPVAGKPAENEIALLKKAGFKEFFLVTDEGPYRNAISLGNFRTEEAAREKIALLFKNGIKSSKILAKPAIAGKIQLNVRGTAELLDKGLAGNAANAVECPKQ